MTYSQANLSQILSQARAGNPVRAWRLFGELGLGDIADDIKVLTLKGRLLKDLAWRAEEDEAKALFHDASQAYLAAYALRTDSYPLINAAALALFAGEEAQSRALAKRVLDLIEGDPEEGETPFWREATRAEAQLLLGARSEAEAALSNGVDVLPMAWEDHARTIEQFAAIIAAQNDQPDWLDRFRPPSSLYFSGMIGLDADAPGLREEIDTAIAAIRPGFVFGALAAGADIMIAEAALAAGARLIVTLPSSVDEFRARSVDPYGADWSSRFGRLIERAERVDQLRPNYDDKEAPFARLVETASLVSMGQAIRNAEILSSHAQAVTIAAPDETERLHIRRWRSSGRNLHKLETPRVANRTPPSGSKTNSGSSVGLNGLISFGEIAERDAIAMAEAHNLTRTSTMGSGCLLGDPHDCLLAFLDVSKREPSGSGCFLVEAFEPADRESPAWDRFSVLRQSAGVGQFVTDFQSAMIARVLNSEIHIEELGEVASLSGPLPVWAIHS